MPAKGTKTTKVSKPKVTRSNVAKSTGKAGLLSKKVKFNWKIAAVIGVVLVAALGYLFVRLSSANAGSRYYPANSWYTGGSNIGEPIVKNDGSRAVASETVGASDKIDISINISGRTSSSTEYCMELATSGSTVISGGAKVNGTTKIKFAERIGATNGKLKKCFWLDAVDARASKTLLYTAESAAGQKSYFYGVTEKATYVVQGEKNAAQQPVSYPAPAPNNTCSGVYGQGNQGDCVVLIQTKLKQLGYDPGPIDGIYGTKTTGAVKLFQSRAGITQDGIVGPQTWSRLFSTSCGQPAAKC
ncbi:MAG: hypothetical protein QG658_445 [Patescibacteria group bacterium]|nr:hypothetical protein [Patescibacteria group bacterium]